MAKYPKMNPKVKRAWVKALRSGKFKQGTGQLRRDDDGTVRHCCLGVLCEVRGVKYRGEAGNLNERQADWAGFADAAATRDGLLTTLAERNDGLRGRAWSFKRIATWIEKHL